MKLNLAAGAAALLTVSVLASASTVTQQSMRCGNELIAVGDSSWDVIKTCGKPDHRETVAVIKDTLGVGEIEAGVHVEQESARYTEVERWYYDGGSNRMDRILTIEGGQLVDISVQR